ncbi:hypothetical protein GUJ93_ZPchr0007g5393 [Zizania palustris]|uniref:Uncharacterized protein n=1 Tax=Zizania palustris TaxID=103762 RepID=A0A8J5T5I3_ZIZPA|nr:hypothetical protein GUJ93_ZPchr0007g5393 [Zizania palustris]
MAVVADLVVDQLKVCIRLKPVGIVANREEDLARVPEQWRDDRGRGSRRSRSPPAAPSAASTEQTKTSPPPRASTRCEDNEASRSSKRKMAATDQAAHVPFTRSPMRPAAPHCMKGERASAPAARDLGFRLNGSKFTEIRPFRTLPAASKKNQASEKAAHLPSTRTTGPTAPASASSNNNKGQNLRHNAPLRPINKNKTVDCREEKDLKSTRQRARISTTPHVPPLEPVPTARLELEALSAEDPLKAAIAKARLAMQRVEARRERDKIVKTMEFNDPFISP